MAQCRDINNFQKFWHKQLKCIKNNNSKGAELEIKYCPLQTILEFFNLWKWFLTI